METTSQSPDLENDIHDFLSWLTRKRFFETEWDMAASAIFFIFVGTVVLLLLLAFIHCCCNCDSPKQRKISRRKVGIDNLAMAP